MTTLIALALFALIVGAAIYADRARVEAAGLRLLIDLSGQLQLTTSEKEATALLPSFARRLFPTLEGAVYVRPASGAAAELSVSWSGERERDCLDSATCAALRSGSSQMSPAGGPGSCLHAAADFPLAATLCTPMMVAGESFGLFLLRAVPGRALPPATARLASSFSQQIGLALSTLRLQQNLRQAAVRDSLTGLYNRRCMEESLTLELLSAGDPDVRVGVILFDVDHFKRFNDTFGHGGGDALLQQLAMLMQSVFGEDDVLCRYGGEEFIAFLPNVSPAVLRSRAEELRRRVRDMQVHCNGAILGSVTISAGIAISPDQGATLTRLISEADLALYAAKAAGRDRVQGPKPYILTHHAA